MNLKDLEMGERKRNSNQVKKKNFDEDDQINQEDIDEFDLRLSMVQRHQHDEDSQRSSCRERNNTRKATVVRKESVARKDTVVKTGFVLNPPPLPERLKAMVPKIPPPLIPEE